MEKLKEVFFLDLLTGKILFTSLFIILIHSIETLAYAVRLSGARVKLIASGLSLFSTIVIVSRMANMGQQPLLGSIIDTAPEQNFLVYVESQFRGVNRGIHNWNHYWNSAAPNVHSHFLKSDNPSCQ